MHNLNKPHKASGWSREVKALKLALCLTEMALARLLLLSPEERLDYEALTRDLRRLFGKSLPTGGLRSELSNRRRKPD